MKKYLFVLALMLYSSVGVSAGQTNPVLPEATQTPNTPTTAMTSISNERQIEIEDRLVSVFENATTEIQYGYIQNLHDGRGYTAGRSGFTSATDDLLEVVTRYTAKNPHNPLARLLPALRAVNGSASTAGLHDLPAAWQACASDPSFIATQNEVNDALYRQPARELSKQLGLRLPLSKAAIYEAGIQHGYGADFDSVNQIVQRATHQVGGTPATGVDERIWLGAFLHERQRNLRNPANQATAKEWAASVDRANAMLSIYNSGNLQLSGIIQLTVFGQTFVFKSISPNTDCGDTHYLM